MSDSNYSNLDYRITRLEKEIEKVDDQYKDEIRRVDENIESFQKEVIENTLNVESIKGKIKSFEATVNWVVKLVIGAVIMALLAMVLKGKSNIL